MDVSEGGETINLKSKGAVVVAEVIHAREQSGESYTLLVELFPLLYGLFDCTENVERK